MKTNPIKTLRREHLTSATLRLRENQDGSPSRTIEGYAIVFDEPSVPMWQDERGEAREVISRDAVTRELLDSCDIKMTMFHDRQLILARSNHGQGTLSYDVDDHGVSFSFDAPNTVDGDKAVELVRRGDISGCSFAFTTDYADDENVERSVVREGATRKETYTVRHIDGIYDFTLTPDPAYPSTSVENRELREFLEHRDDETRRQIGEMRAAASSKIL